MTISPPACRFTSCTLEELPDFLAAADVAVVPRPNSPGIPNKAPELYGGWNAIVSFTRSATILQHKVTAFLIEHETAGGDYLLLRTSDELH